MHWQRYPERAGTMRLSTCFQVLSSAALALATPLLWDGRARFNLTNADLNNNIGPYLTYVVISSIQTDF